MKTYHIGLIAGSGNCYSLHRNGHKKTTVVLQARRDVDNLSCDLLVYYGERETTKKRLHSIKHELLVGINKQYNENFTHIVID